MQDLEKLIKSVLPKGYEYEVFRQRIKKLKVEVSQEEVENLQSSEEVGIGVRVLKDKKLGFSYTSGQAEDDIREAVKKAVEICDLQKPDDANGFIKNLEKAQADSPFDKEGVETPLEEKIDLTLRMERLAKELDKRIKGVRKAGFTEGIFEVELSNSYGVSFSYEGTYYSAMIATLAQEGKDSAISWEFRGARKLKDLDTEDLVRDAVFKAVSLLNPEPVETKVMDVVFFREASAMLLEAFSPMFLGDSYVKGKTLLADKIDEEVANPILTVVDDGALEDGFATVPYDAEGIPRRKNTVIEKGVFKGFLHSLYSASRSGQEPTGNSERGSYKTLPVSGITNLYIERGNTPLEEMLNADREVFLVLELMGLHTVDPVSGEFSLGASGVIFKGGRPLHAVRGVTVAGNVLDLWNKIETVGSDLRFYGNVGSPSLLVRDITVGGS